MPGLGLLRSMVLNNVSPTYLEAEGVSDKVFVDNEADVYNMMRNHFIEFGRWPDLRTITHETKAEFGKYPDEPVEYWVVQVKTRHEQKLVLEGVSEIQSRARTGDLGLAKEKLKDLIIDLEGREKRATISDMRDAVGSAIEHHDRIQRSGRDIWGVPFGLEYLDQVSGGGQPGDMVALVGRPEQGKSFFMLAFANAAYDDERKPLFITMEMVTMQQAMRFGALRSHVTLDNFQRGKMSFWGRGRMVEAMQSMEKPFPVLQASFSTTIEEVRLITQEIEPDILYVDGAYLLRTRKQYPSLTERIGEVAERLKQMAIDLGIPVVASYQFNRAGPGRLENIGRSDLIGQLGSIVLSLKEDEKPLDGSKPLYRMLEIIKGRAGEWGVIKVLYDMKRMWIRQEEIVLGRRDL